MNILGIDPGNTASAYAFVNRDCRPVEVAKLPNREMFVALSDVISEATVVGIEMVASYGMPVGRDVFETCVWIGRFVEHVERLTGREPALVYRGDIKLHLCHTKRAKDPNVSQALIDRFAPGAPNRGKGTKASPGWFYGFSGDLWQAYAVAVYLADQQP